jgi:hypothetical protein
LTGAGRDLLLNAQPAWLEAQAHANALLGKDGAMALISIAVVERTFAWLGRCRRLAKDWENLNRKALAFLRLASIRLMLRKLCNPV